MSNNFNDEQLSEFRASMDSIRYFVTVAFRDVFRNKHGSRTPCLMESYQKRQTWKSLMFSVLPQEFCRDCNDIWDNQVILERNIALNFWQHCDMLTDDKCVELRWYFQPNLFPVEDGTKMLSPFDHAHKSRVLGNTGILNCFDDRESFYRD